MEGWLDEGAGLKGEFFFNKEYYSLMYVYRSAPIEKEK